MTRDLPVLGEVFGVKTRFAATPAGFADHLADAIEHPDPAQREAGIRVAFAHTWNAVAHLELYESPCSRGSARRTTSRRTG